MILLRPFDRDLVQYVGFKSHLSIVSHAINELKSPQEIEIALTP